MTLEPLQFHRGSDSAVLVEMPLITAVKNNNLPQVHALIKSGFNINVYDPVTQGTPLSWAATEGHLEVARALLEADADPNTLIYQGGTPLYIATLRGDEKMVRLLLQYHADPNTISTFPTGHTQTALNIAAKMGWQDIAALLVQKGANIQTALEIAESDGSKAEAFQFLRSLETN